MNGKDTMTENDMSMLVIDAAPVQQISQSEITAATKRMAVIVADAPNMTTEQLATIAQESILYRTVPGRDVHYFLNGKKLSRVLDYKYLKNFATFKEQILSGSDTATLEDSYSVLSETEKIEHNLGDNVVAAKCTIITKRERDNFGYEVKRWLDMGFATDQAVVMAKEVLGGLGTSAVGTAAKTGAVPKGWSHMQLAEKLAFKNAVNRKYGQPTADEMAMMAFRMAKLARPKHWDDVDPTLPAEAQARVADIAAQVEILQDEELTTEEHKERLEKNVSLLRDDDDTPIGEDVFDGEILTPENIEGRMEDKQPSDPWPAQSPVELGQLLNSQIGTEYTASKHILNTVRKQSGMVDWNWPEPEDVDGWKFAYRQVRDYRDAKQAVEQAEQVAADLTNE